MIEPRKHLLGFTPYKSAWSEREQDDMVLLDANENPHSPLKNIDLTGIDLNRYPDPDCTEVKQLYLDKSKLGLGLDNLLVVNGSDEGIRQTILTYCDPGDAILAFTPTFSMYKVCALGAGVEVIEFPLDEDFKISNPNDTISQIKNIPNLKIVFICTPNNPSGNTFDIEFIRKLSGEFGGLVFVDEAYAEFMSAPSAVGLINDCDNVLVSRTLSKCWGIAGVRVGFLISSSKIISDLSLTKLPYNVNIASQALAVKVLEHDEKVAEFVNYVEIEKQKLYEYLKKSKLVEAVCPSEANFYLIRFNEKCPNLYKQLKARKLLVRDFSGMFSDGKQYLRVNIGTESENIKLVEALDQLETLA